MNNLVILDRVDSTNTWAKTHFAELADGTAVAALEQTAGRGRLGRSWISGRGQAVALTMVFKHLAEPWHAGCIVGLAALKLLAALAPEPKFYFKWPNDVYCGGAKIAGILTEGVLENGRPAGMVCGIGLNLNHPPEQLAALGRAAVSLKMLTNRNFPVEKTLSEFAKHLKECYIKYDYSSSEVLALWRRANVLAGETLDLIFPDGHTETVLFGEIAADGAMIAVTPDGRTCRFLGGDVRIVPERIDWEKLNRKITEFNQNN